MEHGFTKRQSISKRMRDLLKALAPHVVVVGSVSRGNINAKDLDLLFNADSDTAYRRVREIIRRSGLKFESCLPGNWTFDEGVQIEVLPIHHGKSYRSCRRKGQRWEFWGIELIVAPADCTMSHADYLQGV